MIAHTDGLPRGWRLAALPDLVAIDGVLTDGDWVESVDQDPNGEVRLTQLADVGDGVFRDRSDRYMTRSKAAELRCTFLEKGDVMIARMPDPLGRACLFPGSKQPCVTVVDVCIVRPGSAPVHTPWLMHFINAPQFRAEVASLQAGSTRKRISKANLSTIALPVPPPAEQREIAAAIESHSSRLDTATATLERVQRNLERYRASVLKAAVEGRLVPTEAELAKKECRSYEPASVLLKRILAERRRRWEEAELAKLKANGKPPRDDRWKSRYEEPAAPDTDGLPHLPEGWCWASCDQLLERLLTGPFGSALHKADYVSGGTPVINPQHLQGFRIEPSERVAVSSLTVARLAAFRLDPGDIVLGRRGQMGRCGVVGDRESGWLLGTGSLALKPSTGVASSYLAWAIRSPRSVRTLEGESVGTTMNNLNQQVLLGLLIALPPAAEQARIVLAIEQHYSVIDSLDQAASHERISLARLRQSILKWAFEGRLA
jgi:type I restriction enzyme, S subunit